MYVRNFGKYPTCIYIYIYIYIYLDTPPIIRNSKTAIAASSFTYVFGCRSLRWLSYRSGRQLKIYVKPEAAMAVFELLMMGGLSPETCWAIKKHWNNKFYCTVASCWLFLWIYIMMHGSMNIKYIYIYIYIYIYSFIVLCDKHQLPLPVGTFIVLTLNPLTWKIWWAPNNSSKRQMGLNSAFNP